MVGSRKQRLVVTFDLWFLELLSIVGYIIMYTICMYNARIFTYRMNVLISIGSIMRVFACAPCHLRPTVQEALLEEWPRAMGKRWQQA